MKKVIIYAVGEKFEDYFFERYSDIDLIKNDRIPVYIEDIVDGSVSKQGQPIRMGNKIFIVKSPDEVDKNSDIYVTSTKNFDQIKGNLINKGFDENKIYRFDEYLYDIVWNRPYKYKVAFTTIMRNERENILEWLDYHILVGVEHFYLYDNYSTDNPLEVLKPFIEKGIVTYNKWENGKGQKEAYDDARMSYGRDCLYMGFIDIDEYVYPKITESIFDGIQQIRNKFECEQQEHIERFFAGVAINWKMFGTSDFVKKPEGGTLKNYVRCAEGYSGLVKSIVNPLAIASCRVHNMRLFPPFVMINESGNPVISHCYFASTSVMFQINHYFSRSEEEYYQKIAKGWNHKSSNGGNTEEDTKRYFARAMRTVVAESNVNTDRGILRKINGLRGKV